MTHNYNPRARHDYTISTNDGCVLASANLTEARAKALVREYTKAMGQEVRSMVLSW